MKFCVKCGTEIKDGADVCLGCGDIINKPVASQKIDNSGISSFILSIIGFWIFAIPFGILAIVFSSIDLKKVNTSKVNRGFAIAGLIIGIIDVIAGILLVSGVL